MADLAEQNPVQNETVQEIKTLYFWFYVVVFGFVLIINKLYLTFVDVPWITATDSAWKHLRVLLTVGLFVHLAHLHALVWAKDFDLVVRRYGWIRRFKPNKQ